MDKVPPERPSKWRKRLILGATVFILLLVGIFIFISVLVRQPAPNGPKYVALDSPPAGQSGRFISYLWSEDVPFQDGKIWLFSALNRTNYHEFLVNIENHKALGEMLNGNAVFFNRDRTKLLCEGRPGFDTTLKDRLVTLISKLSLGRIHIRTNSTETCWILNLRNNSARRAGALSQLAGTSSRWHPSPDFRFGYNLPNNSRAGTSFVLCDLENESFRQMTYYNGDPCGWWDDRHILMQQPYRGLFLYNVITRKETTLLGREDLIGRLRKFGITNAPNMLTIISTWNGANYDFNLIPGHTIPYTNTGFLVKLDRPGPGLTLVKRDFKFRWLGRFNAAGTCYVYPGESGAPGRGGNGALYLLNIPTGNVTTLIPPDNKGQYVIPRFYGDTIIYPYNREIRTVKLDGSGNVLLFPPPDQ